LNDDNIFCQTGLDNTRNIYAYELKGLQPIQYTHTILETGDTNNINISAL